MLALDGERTRLEERRAGMQHIGHPPHVDIRPKEVIPCVVSTDPTLELHRHPHRRRRDDEPRGDEHGRAVVMRILDGNLGHLPPLSAVVEGRPIAEPPTRRIAGVGEARANSITPIVEVARPAVLDIHPFDPRKDPLLRVCRRLEARGQVGRVGQRQVALPPRRQRQRRQDDYPDPFHIACCFFQLSLHYCDFSFTSSTISQARSPA